jgi:hypothetical protein
MNRLLAVCILYSAVAAHGQSPSPRFEVASVKPSNDPPGHSGSDSDGGLLRLSNVTLKRCIMGAYHVGPNLIFGGPNWLDDDRFQIVAKAEGKASDALLMEMLQNLLAERFKLTVHRETRSVQALVLDVAKGGPKMEKGAGDDDETNSGRGRIEAKCLHGDLCARAIAPDGASGGQSDGAGWSVHVPLGMASRKRGEAGFFRDGRKAFPLHSSSRAARVAAEIRKGAH